MSEKSERRRENQRRFAADMMNVVGPVESIIQCGLGDWAEGPVLLEHVKGPMLAVDPINRYGLNAYLAGFRGPIIQALLWDITGQTKTIADRRSRTSAVTLLPISEQWPRIDSFTVTLDDVIEWTGFQVASPCLLWMDAEGSEPFILDGATRTLPHVTSIIIEMKDDTLDHPGWLDAGRLTEKLEAIGFKLITRVKRGDAVFQRIS